MKDLLTHAAQVFFNVVLPKECFVCGFYGTWWCEGCQNKVKLISERLCLGCARPSTDGRTCPSCLGVDYPLDGFLASARYDEPMICQSVAYLKYQGVRDLAKPLSEFIAFTFLQSILPEYWWYTVPIPLHVRRERARGFNQSSLISTYLEEKIGVSCLPLLKRDKITEPQMELNAKERKKNMEQEVFSVIDQDLVLGKNILLVDDVATTGSTLCAAAKVLKLAGASRVWGITVAHD